MTFVWKVWLTVAVVALSIISTAIVGALILGTEIRIERQIEVAGPDEPVYYMIVRGGSLTAIEQELQKNPQVIHDSYIINISLLGHAVRCGRQDVVRLLLEMGADPNGGGRPGEYAPLTSAVSHGQEQIATILIEHGADPDYRGPFGSSPRELAAYEGNQRMLSIMAKAGNRVDTDDSESPPGVPD